MTDSTDLRDALINLVILTLAISCSIASAVIARRAVRREPDATQARQKLATVLSIISFVFGGAYLLRKGPLTTSYLAQAFFFVLGASGRVLSNWHREALTGFRYGTVNVPFILWTPAGRVGILILGQALFWAGVAGLVFFAGWWIALGGLLVMVIVGRQISNTIFRD